MAVVSRRGRRPVKRGPRLAARVADDAPEHDVHGSSGAPSDEPIHDGGDLDGDWTPPAILEAPPPRPGFVQRWIRVQHGNADDAKNIMSRHREGWRARDPRTVPASYGAPTMSHSRFGAGVIVQGMLLCEMPARRNQQRKDYYAGKLSDQTQAVDRDLMKIQRPGNPIHQDRKSQVSVGHGKRPQIMDDDAA